MKLEEEIKQNKPFKTEFQRLVVNINFTSSWLNSQFLQALKPYGISPHQYNVLRILRGKYPDSYTNQDITSRMIDRSSNATRIVDKLKDKKLISRSVNKADRRAVDIRITTKGLELLELIDQAQMPEVTGPRTISEEKARLVNEFLDELRASGL